MFNEPEIWNEYLHLIDRASSVGCDIQNFDLESGLVSYLVLKSGLAKLETNFLLRI